MASKNQVVIDSAQLAVKGGATFAGGSGLFAWLAENANIVTSICAIAGAAIALVGLVVNIYFKAKAHKLAISQINDNQENSSI